MTPQTTWQTAVAATLAARRDSVARAFALMDDYAAKLGAFVLVDEYAAMLFGELQELTSQEEDTIGEARVDTRRLTSLSPYIREAVLDRLRDGHRIVHLSRSGPGQSRTVSIVPDFRNASVFVGASGKGGLILASPEAGTPDGGAHQ